jgi:hypothetical protein
MITLEQYFGKKPHTDADEKNAQFLIARVNCLLIEAESSGVIKLVIDPDTGSYISGSKGGAGDGGFRLSDSATGRAKSSHKEAKGIDIYDPQGKLDKWLDSFEKPNGVNKKLEMYSLYREHASATPRWCHLQTRAPKSGRRTFYP